MPMLRPFPHARRAWLAAITAAISAAVGFGGCGDAPTHENAGASPTSPPRARSSTRVAFVVERDHAECIEGCPEPPEIHSVGVRGGKTTVLLTGADAPTFSPSGKRLAAHTFTGDVDDLASSRIILARPDGSDPRALVSGLYPAWSPDGEQIAFERGDPTDPSIYTVSSRGGSPKPLVRGNTPAWSADGMVAFSRNTERDDQAIAVIRPPRGEARDLTSGHEDGHPDWSPDGTRIAFDRKSARATWIYSIDAHGGGLRRLERGAQPAWSPDGRRIAFIDGYDVLVMRADGSGARSIVDLERFVTADIWATLGEPTWIPSG